MQSPRRPPAWGTGRKPPGSSWTALCPDIKSTCCGQNVKTCAISAPETILGTCWRCSSGGRSWCVSLASRSCGSCGFLTSFDSLENMENELGTYRSALKLFCPASSHCFSSVSRSLSLYIYIYIYIIYNIYIIIKLLLLFCIVDYHY